MCAAAARMRARAMAVHARRRMLSRVAGSYALRIGAWTEDGLDATYSSLADRTEHSVRVDESVSFQWGLGSPAEGIPGEYFAAVWTGRLVGRFSEVILACWCAE